MGAGAKTSVIAVFLLLSLLQTPAYAIKKPYIVYLGTHSHGRHATMADQDLATDSHYDLLGSYLGSKEKAKESVVYSYNKVINGFAAYLEANEATEIAKHPDVISVFPSEVKKLHTTHSWEMLRLERNGRIPHGSLWSKASFGEDVIIATLDTGVWPESKSFKDDGMGPVPSRWKGQCVDNTKEGVRCNRKLIGARYFNKGPTHDLHGNVNSTYSTPRDTLGHGTHTLSTAGGSFVPNASIYSHANGTASGGSPGARVASYKVCWPSINDNGGCYDMDILAAFDWAIHDGVDVISVSLGGASVNMFEDTTAIGAFHAVRNGIVVVCSAGNDGPAEMTVTNVAPWILTVGASTVDRDFVAYATTGDGHAYQGRSLSDEQMQPGKMYPMVKARDVVARYAFSGYAQLCINGTLDPEKVKGKIVVCLRGSIPRYEKGETVRLAGGVGMILVNADPSDDVLFADTWRFPATHINYADGVALFSYLNSTKSPVGWISPAQTRYGVKPHPHMADFSSKGPNPVNPEILKPDVTAPGVDILAAISQDPDVVAELNPLDPRLPSYYLMSGTSMSCPHVSGIVGLLRTLHPEWSPAMIRSAIMTTAMTHDNTGLPMKDAFLEEATPFSYGAGHVRPNRAMDPGLVYDLGTEDYLDFLCAQGYNSTQIELFSKGPYKCPSRPVKLEDLNYPSITIPSVNGTATVTRRLKNVGRPGTYTVRIRHPEGFTVSVVPEKLRFGSFGEEKKVEITVTANNVKKAKGYRFGTVVWSDGRHHVRSPVVVQSSS